MFVSTTNVATKAAIKPNKIRIIVATRLWRELLAISLTDFSANLQPTEAPKIKRQKLIEASGNL